MKNNVNKLPCNTVIAREKNDRSNLVMYCIEIIGVAMLPSAARALKDDVVILKKCPWGAMTRDNCDADSLGEKEPVNMK